MEGCSLLDNFSRSVGRAVGAVYSDGVDAEVFVAYRSGTELRYAFVAGSWVECAPLLASLLCGPTQDTHCVARDSSGSVVYGAMIASGLTSGVFSVFLNPDSVVKVALDESWNAVVAREYQVLSELQMSVDDIGGSSGRIPAVDVTGQYLSQPSGRLAIVMSNCGESLSWAEFRPGDAILVLDVLAFAHSRGWVHGDVRLANVVKRDDRIALVDWGFATKMGEPNSECGGFSVAPEDQIQFYETGVRYACSWKHDVESVLRMVAVRRFAMDNKLSALPRDGYADGKTVWATSVGDEFLNLLAALRASDVPECDCQAVLGLVHN